MTTPVFDQFASKFSMRKKQTPQIKEMGIGCGGGGAALSAREAPGDGASRGQGKVPALSKPGKVPRKQDSK